MNIEETTTDTFNENNITSTLEPNTTQDDTQDDTQLNLEQAVNSSNEEQETNNDSNENYNNEEKEDQNESNEESDDNIDIEPQYQYSNIELYQEQGEFYLYNRTTHKSSSINIVNNLIKSESKSLESYLDDVYDDIKYDLGHDYINHFKWKPENLIVLIPILIKNVNELQEEKGLGPLKKAIVMEMMYSLIEEYVQDEQQNKKLHKTLRTIIPNVIDLTCNVATHKLDINKYPRENVGILTKIWKFFF